MFCPLLDEHNITSAQECHAEESYTIILKSLTYSN